MPIAYVLVFAVILFMLWTTYSQQRRAKKAAAELQRLLKKGDEVLTVGGMFGIIRKMGDDYVILEVESGAHVRLLRRAIREILSEEDDDYLDTDDDLDDLDDEDADYDEVDEDEGSEEDDDDYVEDEEDDAEYDEVDAAQDEDEAPSAPTAPTPPADGR